MIAAMSIRIRILYQILFFWNNYNIFWFLGIYII